MAVRFDRTHLSPAESRRLARNLKAARKAAGLSLGSLARWLKLPEATLRAYERGRARFPVRLIFAAARALRVSPYQLMAGASDRVLNSWGPNVLEWHRVCRSKVRHLEETTEEDEMEEEEALDEEGSKLELSVQDRWGGEPLEILEREEAQRAIVFLDEPGPSGRFEPEEDEQW